MMATPGPSATPRAAVRTDLVVLVFGFMALIFCLVGAIGTAVFSRHSVDWFTAEQRWVPVRAQIVSGTIQTSRARRGGIVVRPWFTFVIEGEPDSVVHRGYDLGGVYMSDQAWAQDVLARFPPGARVGAWRNPTDRREVILERGPFAGMVLGFVPPFFVLLGLLMGTTSLLRGIYLARGRPQQGFFGGLIAAGHWFVQEHILRRVFFTAIALITGTVLLAAVSSGNPFLYVTAVIIVWGVWQASRPRRSSKR